MVMLASPVPSRISKSMGGYDIGTRGRVFSPACFAFLLSCCKNLVTEEHLVTGERLSSWVLLPFLQVSALLGTAEDGVKGDFLPSW